MARISKKILTQKITPQKIIPKVAKARPMIQFGTGASRGCFGESITCEKIASLILTCADVQAAINAVSATDIYVVSVIGTGTPGIYTATLSDGSTFSIDLTDLVENQTLSFSGTNLVISEGNSIDLCPIIAVCIQNNGLPAGVDLFTLNGALVETGSTHNITLDSNGNTMELDVDGTTVSTAPIINTNVQTLVGTTLTSTVNGISAPVDLAPLMNSAVFQSNDDQVLTAGATSDMDVQLVPTTVTDPDSQVNKTNYEISITPKPTVICSGNPLSATNKLITTDSLTTNATLPANITGTPDTTDANNVFLKAEKRLSTTGCGEDVYVPAQRMVTRQTLTPTAIVTANPLIPNLIGASGKDYYVSTVGFSSTIPTGGDYIYDFAWDCQYDFSSPNADGRINGFVTGTGITYRGPHDDQYSKDVINVLCSPHGKAESSTLAGGTVLSLSVNIYHGVDTGIALLMAGGGISFGPYFSTAITFYPTN